MSRLLIAIGVSLCASVSSAQTPSNCAIGGFIIQPDSTIWVCAGPSTTPTQISTGGTPTWDDVTGKPSTFAPIIGSGAAEAVAGNDARLTDARTPTSHNHLDADIPNTITINLAAAATALASDPTDCGANQFATTIGANGNLTCAAIGDASVPDTITLTNLTQVTTRAISDTTGTLAVARGGTNLTASADDNLMVGNGTTWQTKALPSCSNAASSKLLYDTATNVFSCGTDQTSAGGASDTVLTLAGQVSTGANTTLVDITGMAFTADADGLYEITIFAAVNNAAATTGFGIGLNCAQAPQLLWMTGNTQLANTGTTSTWSAIANNAIAGVTSGVPTLNVDVPTHGGGMLRAHAANAGTCTFRLRSETTAVARMQAGSLFIVKKRN